ncbi:hypothetical protein KP509_23G003800 [Ceratopteris richardii]|uniref:Uncharacterized protein n=1 Tax=Ceratopteris richardii TaxID=49495 RepID=A0A8T2RZ78_CERRI|nr:hypothetical protein KP509_23G003800 [Ceratopteris richardii]
MWLFLFFAKCFLISPYGKHLLKTLRAHLVLSEPCDVSIKLGSLHEIPM